MDARTGKENVSDLTLHIGLLYLINIHCLSVDFDWSRAGHGEGAILLCRMIILPSDVISSQKLAPALVVTCLFTVHVEGAILSCRMIILRPLLSYPPKCAAHVFVMWCVTNLFQKWFGVSIRAR